MFSEIERTGVKSTVAYFKTFRHSPVGTEESHEASLYVSQCSNPFRKHYKSECNSVGG